MSQAITKTTSHGSFSMLGLLYFTMLSGVILSLVIPDGWVETIVVVFILVAASLYGVRRLRQPRLKKYLSWILSWTLFFLLYVLVGYSLTWFANWVGPYTYDTF